MQHQHIRQLRHDSYRHKGGGIVTKPGIEALVDGERRWRSRQERVAVRLGTGDDLCTDILRGAWPVLDHHRLTPFGGELIGDNAWEAIGGGARRDRDDDAHRSGGETVLSPHHPMRRAEQRCETKAQNDTPGRWVIPEMPHDAPCSPRAILFAKSALALVSKRLSSSSAL